MIITHTEHTKPIPAVNCWEWMVYAEVNYNAWKCISDEDYQIMKAKEDHFRNGFGIVMIVSVIVWIIISIYVLRDY